MVRPALATALLLAMAGSAASANDGAAGMTAGGLVLRNNSAVDMVDEDLFISRAQIRVRYVFRNQTARDVRVLVAFPIPDRSMRGMDDNENGISHFQTRVDGQPVRVQVEEKAVVRNVDQSAALRRLNVPIGFDGEGRQDSVQAALDRLTPVHVSQLRRLGLVEVYGSGSDRQITPKWAVRIAYYWEQVFPAGRDVIVEHQYSPGPDTSNIAALAQDGYRTTAEGRRVIGEYCADPSFLGGIDRMVARRGSDGWGPPEYRIGYILRTGGSWRSPIRRFRLVVDKGSPDAIVSFCGTGVRRISPTQFEMTRTNWRPDHDLALMFVTPPEASPQ